MQFLVPILIAFASSLVARMLLGAGLALFTHNWIMGLVEDAQNEISQLNQTIEQTRVQISTTSEEHDQIIKQ